MRRGEGEVTVEIDQSEMSEIDKSVERKRLLSPGGVRTGEQMRSGK